MGFFRNRQIGAVKRLLCWQYEKKGLPKPPAGELNRQAEAIVKRAGAVAGRTGKNIVAIAREMLADWQKK